ncbi:hypothetical protein JL107_04575 [Nakamurella flavida]|uniref:Uncharacterized protein n=1 Tax=Nakamurella flavida TaxID=363630 RepID=A0A938YDK4_9ACTN|nr:hypothetical protein [Nakamurella flavida]MBM9475716.1 hypothetical protein [Nakamurella flavida]MDP9778006.1 hypothetical protein [Nakamurella flavida]
MSVLGDLRTASTDAVTRLAVRFSDLPRPVLAVIGAGDFIAEQMQELREAAASVVDGPAPAPAGDPRADAGSRVPHGDDGTPGADPVERARQAAADLAAQIPDRVGRIAAEFPERVADLGALAGQFAPDALRDTAEAYGHLAGTVYSALAVRGRRTWSRARAGGGPGSVVDGVAS